MSDTGILALFDTALFRPGGVVSPTTSAALPAIENYQSADGATAEGSPVLHAGVPHETVTVLLWLTNGKLLVGTDGGRVVSFEHAAPGKGLAVTDGVTAGVDAVSVLASLLA
jgi:hypothetical protein